MSSRQASLPPPSPTRSSLCFESGSVYEVEIKPERRYRRAHHQLEPFTEQCDRYLLDFQLWDTKNHTFTPYDPSTFAPPPVAIKESKNYFHVKVQYMDYADEPTYLMCNWSDTLLLLMRSCVGNTFFERSPEVDVKSLFANVRDLRSKPSAVKEALVQLDEDVEKARPLAVNLGFLEANDAKLPEASIRNFLLELEEHLSVALAYIESHFKVVEEKLERLKAYGHIEFNLLPYLFNVGDHVITKELRHTIGFVIQSRAVQANRGAEVEFVIYGNGYEWNGDSYSTYGVMVHLPFFEGTRETSSLTCQHLTDQVKEQLRTRGRIYASYSGTHYKTYQGDRVIVDRLGYDNNDGYTAEPDRVIPELPDENLHLAPAQVKGFNLARKGWASFDVELLKPVVFDESAWDHLVLDTDTKTLIRALVKVTQNSNTTSKIMSDVISGKGGGLIAVLHGPPGTGKTLTAEGVAEILRRPLYMVGASELSTKPSQLEENLKGILSLATAWDAVLLIDEADVFLEKRSLHETERNALVSVALRVFEYHRGVLFLTTNRIKTFDGAFLSRFSIAIKYPELDQTGRAAVWKKFLELAGCNLINPANREEANFFSSDDVEALAEKAFNGRTIKNIVRTAQALAISSDEPLRLAHVKIVIRAQEKFLDEFASAGHDM